MRKSLLIITALSVIASDTLVESISLPVTDPTFCGYVGSRIYCVGIPDKLQSQDMTAGGSLYTLDINQFAGRSIDSMKNEWKIVVPNNSFDIESRINTSAVVLSDGKRFLLHGGANENGAQFVNQTIIYDSIANIWENATIYTNDTNVGRQISCAAAVNLPDNCVGFYGGVEQNFDEGTEKGDQRSAELIPGYVTLKTYSLNTLQWKSIYPQNSPGNYNFHSQTATFDSVSGKVYYLGGLMISSTMQNAPFRFQSARIFNTKNGNWSIETLGGAIPSERMFHTANLLPNSRDIILYGGKGANKTASTDYCFTLNILDKTWTNHSKLDVPSDLSGPRYRHSAVLVDTTLFILFGYSVNGTLNPSFFSIDVGNAANISYSPTFNIKSPSNNEIVIPPNNNTLGNKNEAPTSLSSGAIGGIVAGVVVVVLAIIIIVYFRLRKKKGLERNNNSDYTTEKIYVTWNKADDQYRDIPPVDSNITGSPHPTSSENNTRVGTTHTPDTAPTLRSYYVPNLASINVVEDDDLSVDHPHGEKVNSKF